MTDTDLKFRFSVASICAAEAHLKMKLADILADMESDSGIGLRTLRALMAAGMPPTMVSSSRLTDMMASMWFDDSIDKAARLISSRGVAACSAAVGTALGAFLITVQ